MRAAEPEPPVTSLAALPPLPSPAALRLGYAGLLPFMIGAAAAWFGPPAWHATALAVLAGYAAVIASFLGGIHWGFAMRGGTPVASLAGWGVLPSLVAWVALSMPARAGLALLGAALLACWWVDRRVYPAQGAAAWLGLRTRLSAVATLACWAGSAAA